MSYNSYNKLWRSMMKKVTSRSALARELIKQGVSVKDIARRTGLSKQTIYTVKWKMANKQGLGAIKPTTPTVAQGTGIAASVPRAAIPLEFEIIDRPKKKSNNRRNAQLKRWARERAERERRDLMNAVMPLGFAGSIMELTPPKPTMWQRIKGFFGA